MFRNQREWLRYQAARDGGDGNGNGGGGDNHDQSGAAAFQQALQAHQNDLQRFATELFDDNFTLRRANRDLRNQVAPAGSVILQGDDLTRWQAYQALGAPTDLVLASTVTPVRTDLANAQSALATAQAEITTLKRGALLREVADASGMVYSVLSTLDKPDLGYTVTDGKDKEGKPVKTIKVKAGDQETELDAYAAQHWRAFLPALRPTQSSGTPFVAQAGSGGKPNQPTAATAAADYLARRYGPPQKTE